MLSLEIIILLYLEDKFNNEEMIQVFTDIHILATEKRKLEKDERINSVD